MVEVTKLKQLHIQQAGKGLYCYYCQKSVKVESISCLSILLYLFLLLFGSCNIYVLPINVAV